MSKSHANSRTSAAPETIATAGQGHGAGQAPAHLVVSLARSQSDLREAQRLRYQVFAEEMGAQLDEATPGIDQDEFDLYCDHLLVREKASGVVVGTYRILPPHRREQIGRLYSASEFDLRALQGLQSSMIEVGRSCVHPDHRTGAAILLLWAGLARYMRAGRYQHLVGCASISLADSGLEQAAALRDKLQDYLCESQYRAYPLRPFAHQNIRRAPRVDMPPLIKGYLRLGAKVCGEPALDAAFNTADFLIWLSLADLPPRYARHFDLLATQAAFALA
jgi:putative hemolysin